MPAAQRDEAIARLARAGYLDDTRFAEARASSLAQRGYGDAAIRADLDRRGVEREVVEQALASLVPEQERARRAAAELGAGPRTARTLIRKGFAPESIDAVESAVAQEP